MDPSAAARIERARLIPQMTGGSGARAARREDMDMTTDGELDAIHLGKWPRLLVAGQPITEEQADEVIVRTSSWHLSANDREWERLVYGLIGISLDGQFGFPRYEQIREFVETVRGLDLHYLHNERVASSWIGGPHGWCNWDGAVGCTNYNIGKWPGAGGVLEDWTAIAAAFPYLDLTCQLVPEEGDADRPAVEYRVAGGAVTVDAAPERFLTSPSDLDEATIIGRLVLPRAERGVELMRLRRAVERVRAARTREGPTPDGADAK